MNAIVTEASVLAGALDLLEARGFPAWRVNSGGLRTPSGGFLRFGFAGCPDVWGLVPCTHGRLITVEVKRPGRRPDPDQLAVLGRLRDAGAAAVWISDLGRLDAILRVLLRSPNAIFSLDGEFEGLALGGVL